MSRDDEQLTHGRFLNGSSHTFTSNNLWSGTDSANVTGNGTTTLTVTAAGLAAFSQISITDAAVAGTSVTFNDSGANAYMDNFDIVLDDPGAGTITFNGTTSFTRANTLSVSTSRNIAVNSGARVTTADGDLTFSRTRRSRRAVVQSPSPAAAGVVRPSTW